jgi:hypothetical protein
VLYHTSLFHPADTVARKESRCTRVAAGEETGGQDIDAPSFFCLNIQASMWITSRKRART